MAEQYTIQDVENAIKARGGVVDSSSVLYDTKPDSSEFLKGAESLAKGAVTGLVKLAGGWGTLYDYLKGSKEPSALSTTGILQGAGKLTGVDFQQIPGYKGAYDFGEAATPAMAIGALAPSMGLFNLSKATSAAGVTGRTLGEGAIAGTTGVAAQMYAPDSPSAQLLIGMSPYAAKGAYLGVQRHLTRPEGTVSPLAESTQRVGPLTPGEATGSRMQLTNESKVAASPKIEAKEQQFRMDQANSGESFISDLFKRASDNTVINPEVVAGQLSTAFENKGKSLASTLRSAASKDFGLATKLNGSLSGQPVFDKLSELKANLKNLSTSDMAAAPAIDRILNELTIKGTPEATVASKVLDAQGNPASTTVVPAVPDRVRDIRISELKKAISDWGQTAYSGSYALGGSNVFEGVAAGQAKGIARTVLNGYKDALSKAIEAGVPGASELTKARNNFSVNLKAIDDFAERPIVKTFGVPSNQLVPETVMAKLKDMPQTQRSLLFDILGNAAPDMANTIRRLQFDDVLARSQNLGASVADPAASLPKLLQQLNSKNGELSFLFPKKADLQDAQLAVQWLKQVVQKDAGVLSSGTGDLYAGIRGVGGSAQQALLATVIADAKGLLATPNALADIMFNPSTVSKMADLQRKSTPAKLLDISKDIAATLAKQAPRAVQLGDTTGARVENQGLNQEQNGQQAPTIDEVNARIKELEQQ